MIKYVNEKTELVSGIIAPHFGDESSWVRGSELIQGSSGSCVSRILGARVAQVEDH
jgi:hypothetical protein